VKKNQAIVKTKYNTLKYKLSEIETLNGVKGLLSWDAQVMLAPGDTFIPHVSF
jgi:hypothetical protein